MMKGKAHVVHNTYVTTPGTSAKINQGLIGLLLFLHHIFDNAICILVFADMTVLEYMEHFHHVSNPQTNHRLSIFDSFVRFRFVKTRSKGVNEGFEQLIAKAENPMEASKS